MIYGTWQTATIANTEALSGIVDLGRDWEFAQMAFGAMTAANISLLVSPHNSTFYELAKPLNGAVYLGSDVAIFNCLTGNFATEIALGGYQYAKVNCSVAQGAERTVKIRGCRS